MENIAKLNSVISGFTLSLGAIDSYVCRWFEHLPLEAMEDIIGNYNAPDRADYESDEEGEECYNYDVADYMDDLHTQFSEVNLEIKLNDFKNNAYKYADRMTGGFIF